MKKEEVIDSLLKKAESDAKTAQELYNLKRYDWSLFIWHLVIEKSLKAKIVSLGEEIIYTHDLVRLAKKAQISMDAPVRDQLREITTFNIEARYDDYKLSFYAKANSKYSQKWNKICEKLYITIINSI